MKKRYQVFVSSTFRDLIDERRAVMQALLELDCIPAGMELFPASSDEAFKLIQRVIDESDYYVVLVGGRYGSLDAAGISYTEKEFDYAVATGKHILGFLHKDPESIPVKFSEQDADLRAKLQAFRAKVEQRLCKYWTTADELGGIVSRSIVQIMNTYPAEGWVQARYAKNVEELENVNRMHQQIRTLEKELESLRQRPGNDLTFLAQGADPVTIRYSGGNDDAELQTTWNEIFLRVARSILEGSVTPSDIEFDLRIFVALRIGQEEPRHIMLSKGTLSNICIQLVSLGLIDVLSNPVVTTSDPGFGMPTHQAVHTQATWRLTEQGRRVLAEMAGARKPQAAIAGQ